MPTKRPSTQADDWPPAVQALLVRRSRIAVLQCDDPRRFARQIAHACNAASFSPALIVDAPDLARDFVAAWCGVRPPVQAVSRSLLVSARRYLGLGAPSGDSAVERHWQVEAATGPDNNSQHLPLADVLARADPADPVKVVGDALSTSGHSDAEQFQQITRIWGRGAPAIVAVVAPEIGVSSRNIARIVHAVELSPEAKLLLTVDPTGWQELNLALDPHSLALLQEGFSELPAAALAPAAAAVCTSASPADITSLRQRAHAAVQAALALPAPRVDADRLIPPAYGEARSLAEALLDAALQADPRTAGLFVLNAPGGFAFGPRPAEIDLLCRALGIAIEVDGYFHFQDKSAYRRDRAKDWLMQQNGLLVLRFLAEDVTERLEEIVARVADAVGQKRSGSG